jgi:hypothetical protein
MRRIDELVVPAMMRAQLSGTAQAGESIEFSDVDSTIGDNRRLPTTPCASTPVNAENSTGSWISSTRAIFNSFIEDPRTCLERHAGWEATCDCAVDQAIDFLAIVLGRNVKRNLIEIEWDRGDPRLRIRDELPPIRILSSHGVKLNQCPESAHIDLVRESALSSTGESQK